MSTEAEPSPTELSASPLPVGLRFWLLLQGAAIPLGYALLVCLLAFLGRVSNVFGAMRLVAIVAWFGIVAAAFGFTVAGFSGKNRRLFHRALGALTAALLLIGNGIGTGWAVDRWAILEMTSRARPLISAIKQYATDHGAPPPSLNALVPKYLPNGIPETGLGPGNPFDYTPWGPPEPGWQLEVISPWPRFLPDKLRYSPDTNVTAVVASEYIDGWAYIPE